MPYRITSLRLTLLFITLPAFSTLAADATPAAITPTLADRVKSPDANTVHAALDEINTSLSLAPGETLPQISQYVRALAASHHPDLAAALAHRGVLCGAVDLNRTTDLLMQEVRCRLQMHDAEHALQNAKSLFNLCRPEDTEQVLLLFAEALGASHPNDPAAANRFIREQLNAPETTTAVRPFNTLTRLPINAADYLAQLDQYDPYDIPTRINILLLADQPEKAAQLLPRFIPDDHDPSLTLIALRARIAKAFDGSIGRANRILQETIPPPAAHPRQ